jgi:hypothetical protein
MIRKRGQRQYGTSLLAENLAYGPSPGIVPLAGATDKTNVQSFLNVGNIFTSQDDRRMGGINWSGKMVLNVPYNKPS